MRRLILSALLLASAVPALAQVTPPPPVAADPRDGRDRRGDDRQGQRPDERRPDERRPDDRRMEDRRPDQPAGAYRPDDRRVDDRGYRGEVRQDDRRDFRDDRRQEDRRDFRDDRRDFHDDRRNLRQDERREFRDDRRDYRQDERFARFRGEQFAYPRGYGYRYYGVGAVLPRVFFGSRYYIARPDFYRLPPAFRGTRWVRVGPDALLIRSYDGRVVRVLRGLFY